MFLSCDENTVDAPGYSNLAFLLQLEQIVNFDQWLSYLTVWQT